MELQLGQQMEFAKALAVSDLLPNVYRGKPGNVLLAIGLGQTMGLSPAESVTRIYVVDGKPSAGAELIASNVRRAGHKLRVKGDAQACVATIIRADDPDFEFTESFTIDDAKRAKLLGKDNWQNYPAAMLRARAITAVARAACPEALYGVSYTMEEISDDIVPPAAVSLQEKLTLPKADVVTSAQLAKLWASAKALGVADDDEGKNDLRRFCSIVIGRDLASSKDMTKVEASTVFAAMDDEERCSDIWRQIMAEYATAD